MPERTVQMLTGSMPEPILVIPSDTWDTFELNGAEGEFVIMAIKKALNSRGETIMEINETVKVPTHKYTNLVGGRGTGVIIPKNITQSYGIRLDHYLEVVLEKVEKVGKEIEVFPKRMVEEHFPSWWHQLMKEL